MLALATLGPWAWGTGNHGLSGRRKTLSTQIVGKIVKGPSGRHLGRATDETTTRFCVEIDGQAAWIPRDTVFSVEDEEVTVIFEPSAIARYALETCGSSERTA